MRSKLTERLNDASRSGVYRVTRGEALAECAPQRTGIALQGGKAEILAAIAKALRFPDWFGGNWDALEDCLSDLEGAQVLVFTGGETLAADERGILVDILDSAASFHGAQGTPFFAVFLDPQRALSLPDLHKEK
jgi:hypothetical protein